MSVEQVECDIRVICSNVKWIFFNTYLLFCQILRSIYDVLFKCDRNILSFVKRIGNWPRSTIATRHSVVKANKTLILVLIRLVNYSSIIQNHMLWLPLLQTNLKYKFNKFLAGYIIILYFPLKYLFQFLKVIFLFLFNN